MKAGLTIAFSKTAAGLSRLTGRGRGQALPGLVADRLDPHLAAKYGSKLPHGIVLVTGTNGKTTTTKMAVAMFERGGEEVLTNNTGSNLKRGITSAFVSATTWSGHLRGYTMALFEVDEASLPKVAAELQPRAIVVLNLFRDQLDRYGELDTTAAMIGRGISATECDVYLNADDPLVVSLAKYAHDPAAVHYFGIEGLPVSRANAGNTVVDSDRCPICGEQLTFSRQFYAHLGHYRCNRGHFSRPRPSVVVTAVDKSDHLGTNFTVAIDGKRHSVSLALPGNYNLYNALAALSLSQGLGFSLSDSVSTLTKTSPAFGRVERIDYKGRLIYLLLIKNPVGFSQIIETFLVGSKEQRVLIAINDLAADGRDVSWLWDVPIEVLAGGQPNVIVSGLRATDMRLRLHYAGIKSEMVSELGPALNRAIEFTPRGESLYILPTYTAMLEVRKLLSKLVHIPEMGS